MKNTEGKQINWLINSATGDVIAIFNGSTWEYKDKEYESFEIA